jgi:hypothetical protein
MLTNANPSRPIEQKDAIEKLLEMWLVDAVGRQEDDGFVLVSANWRTTLASSGDELQTADCWLEMLSMLADNDVWLSAKNGLAG